MFSTIYKVYNYFSGKSSFKKFQDLDEKTVLRGNLLTMPKGSGGEFNKIFKKAYLSLRIVDENQFDYQMEVCNSRGQLIYEFPINVNSRFKFCFTKGHYPWLCWESKSSSDEIKHFCFSLGRKTHHSHIEFFLDALCTLIGSVVFQIPLRKADEDSAKDEYIIRFSRPFNNILDLIENSEKATEKPYTTYSSEKAFTDDEDSKESEEEITISFSGSLYEFSRRGDELVLIDDNATIYIIKNGNYYFISTQGYDSVISDKSDVKLNEEDENLMWICQSKRGNKLIGFLFMFSNSAEFSIAKEKIYSILLEAKEKENNYYLNHEKDYSDEETSSYSEISNWYGTPCSKCPNLTKDPVINIASTQAHLFNRSFVLHSDSSLSVYKTDQNNQLVQTQSIATPVNADSVKQIECFNNDTGLLLLDSQDSAICEYDLTKNKIISEWSSSNNSNILGFTLQDKQAKANPSPLVVAITPNSVLQFDSRLNNNGKISNCVQYKSNTKFSSIGTDNQGNIAIGNEKGELRLYEDVKSYAKSLISCYGDNIKYLELTKDGKYCLATTAYYLLVVDLQNGFEKNVKRSDCRFFTLVLSKEDILRYDLEGLEFTKARFDNWDNSKETSIVCGIGGCIVVWDFNKVKEGILNEYKIKCLSTDDGLLENCFKYNGKDIIGLMERCLCLQSFE